MNKSNSPVNQSLPDGTRPAVFHLAVKSGFWVSALRIVTKILDFGKYLLLLNVLGRAGWGLLGMALATLSVIGIFTEPGFNVALIQKKEKIEDYLDTVWTSGLIRGIFLFTVLFFFAPYAARFFDGSAVIQKDHILKSAALIVKFRDSHEPLSSYIFEGFSPSTRRLIDEYQDSTIPAEPLRTALTAELNQLIEGPNLYRDDLFEHVELSNFARNLLSDARQNGDCVRLNRRLLQEAYPGLIKETVIDVPTMTRVVQVLGFTVIIGSLINIGTIGFKKELRFHKQFIYEISSKLADITVTIAIVLIYRSVWALVWGRVASAITTCVISYTVHPYRPRIAWDYGKAMELWRFGRWIQFASIPTFIMTQGIELFVGKKLGPEMLGLFLIACRFAQAPATEITSVLSEVTFPAYSKLQTDMPRLKNAYLKVLNFTAFITIPLSGLVFILAPYFITLFLKKEFLPAIPVLQILAFQGLTFSLQATIGPVYRAVGKPGINLWIQLVRVALLVMLISPFTARWGIVGTAWTILLIAIIVQPLGFSLLVRIIKCRFGDIFRSLLPPLAGTVVMLAVITLVRLAFFRDITIISFGLLVVTGALSYLAAAFLFEKLFGYNIRQIFQEQFAVLLKKH